MSPPRFTPEFKDEAVRQITERGYSVAEVSARLGVFELAIERLGHFQGIEITRMVIAIKNSVNLLKGTLLNGNPPLLQGFQK
jgi:hypothetical protein